MHFLRLTILLLVAWEWNSVSAANGANLESVAYFESHIRPVLVNHCYECHSGDEAKAGLRLDYRGGWQKGGKSGPAIVPPSSKYLGGKRQPIAIGYPLEKEGRPLRACLAR